MVRETSWRTTQTFETPTSRLSGPVAPPDEGAWRQAKERLNNLAKPLNSLGRFEELGAWLAACQRRCPPMMRRINALVMAADHGLDGAAGVLRTSEELSQVIAGRSACAVMASESEVDLRAFDIGIDQDPVERDAPVTKYKISRTSQRIDIADPLSPARLELAFGLGELMLSEQTADRRPDLLIVAHLGVGKDESAGALIASTLNLPATSGSGPDASAREQESAKLITAAVRRIGRRAGDPWQRLAGLGSYDIAAGVAMIITAARNGIPVLLDDVVSAAELLLAEEIAPGTAHWCQAGHAASSPLHAAALKQLGLRPLVDLDLRLGAATGALAAVPAMRSAAMLMRRMAFRSDQPDETQRKVR